MFRMRTCPLVNARARNSRDILQLPRNPLRRTEIAACRAGRRVTYIRYTRKCAQTEIHETSGKFLRGVIRSLPRSSARGELSRISRAGRENTPPPAIVFISVCSPLPFLRGIARFGATMISRAAVKAAGSNIVARFDENRMQDSQPRGLFNIEDFPNDGLTGNCEADAKSEIKRNSIRSKRYSIAATALTRHRETIGQIGISQDTHIRTERISFVDRIFSRVGSPSRPRDLSGDTDREILEPRLHRYGMKASLIMRSSRRAGEHLVRNRGRGEGAAGRT